MKVFIILIGLWFICGSVEAHWIRVNGDNMIFDSASERVNLSNHIDGMGTDGTITIHEVPKTPFPKWGDHFVNGVVIQDSIKRQEAIEERNARKTRAITIRNKLIQKGFTGEEATDFIRAIFGIE